MLQRLYIKVLTLIIKLFKIKNSEYLKFFNTSILDNIYDNLKNVSIISFVRLYFDSFNYSKIKHIYGIECLMMLHTLLLLNKEYKKLSFKKQLSIMSSFLIFTIFYWIFKICINGLFIIPIRWVSLLLSVYLIGVDLNEILSIIASYLKQFIL